MYKPFESFFHVIADVSYRNKAMTILSNEIDDLNRGRHTLSVDCYSVLYAIFYTIHNLGYSSKKLMKFQEYFPDEERHSMVESHCSTVYSKFFRMTHRLGFEETVPWPSSMQQDELAFQIKSKEEVLKHLVCFIFAFYTICFNMAVFYIFQKEYFV